MIHILPFIIALITGIATFFVINKYMTLSILTNAITSLLIMGIIFYATSFFIRPQQTSVNAPSANNLIVGTTADFPPFEFIENTKIVGFDIDIITEVAKRLEKKIEFKNMPFDTLIPELQLGKIHLIGAGLTETPERAQQGLFTKPFLSGVPLVAISLKKNTPITNLSDLTGKTVAVNTGYTADMFMSKVEGPILQRLPAAAEAFLAVQTGRVYAFVTALNTVKPFFEKYGTDEFNIFTIPDTDENNALLISKKYPDLLPQIQKALDDMKNDGTIDILMKKWKLA
jgi:polar amino acid transport system substrate-binding protein